MFPHDEYVVKYNEAHLLFTTQRILSSCITLHLERPSQIGCGKSQRTHFENILFTSIQDIFINGYFAGEQYVMTVKETGPLF